MKNDLMVQSTFIELGKIVESLNSRKDAPFGERLFGHEEALDRMREIQNRLLKIKIEYPSGALNIREYHSEKDVIRVARESLYGTKGTFVNAYVADMLKHIDNLTRDLVHEIRMSSNKKDDVPAFISFIARYLGKGSDEEHNINKKMDEFSDTLSHFCDNIHYFAQDMPMPTNFEIGDITKRLKFIDRTIGDEGLKKFPNAQHFFQKMKEFDKKFVSGPTPSEVLAAKTETSITESVEKKKSSKPDMSFTALYRYYKDFCAAIEAKIADKEIIKMSAVLSSPELRELTGLKAIRYNPATYFTKMDQVTHSADFKSATFNKKLREAIKTCKEELAKQPENNVKTEITHPTPTRGR